MAWRSQIASVLLLIALLTGCGRENRVLTAPTAERVGVSALDRASVQAEDLGRFYPLDIGNRWRYAGFTHSKHGDVEKGGRWTKETTLARSVVRNGGAYVEEQITITDEQQQFQGVRWLRQDRSGLFETGVPPPSAPLDYETMLLAYPLHRGATWVVSESPRITATVEGSEVLDTPAGRLPSWRIRLRNAGHHPSEEVFVWYGRAGYLGMKRHDQYERLGPDGNPVEVVIDEAEWLASISLSKSAP